MKDVWWGTADGRAASSAATPTSATRARYWDFRTPGRGDDRLRGASSARSTTSATPGPLSVEWEDSGMDREHGAAEARGFVRRLDFAPSAGAFDAAFAKER